MRVAHIKVNYISNPHQFSVPNFTKKQDKVIVKTAHGFENGSIVSIYETSEDNHKYNSIETVVSNYAKVKDQDVNIELISLGDQKA